MPADAAGALLDTLASPDDRLWPHDRWPPMRLDRGLVLGAVGGHGPIGYEVVRHEPGRAAVFRFRRPTGFRGHHGFVVRETSPSTCVLQHELRITVRGTARVTWPLVFRPLHDALIEECLDTAARSLGTPPDDPHRRSPWVRALRSLAVRLRAVEEWVGSGRGTPGSGLLLD